MFYIDTSVLISAFIQEKESERALTWIEKRPTDRLAISGWTITEFSSALGIKARMAQIDETDRSRALLQFDRMIGDDLTILEVTDRHFRKAAALIDRPRIVLRGGDALHLAIASDKGSTVATLDRRMANAARALNIATELIA